MNFLKDIFNNFLSFVFALLSLVGLVIGILYLLSGQVLNGVAYIVGSLLCLAVAKALSNKRR